MNALVPYHEERPWGDFVEFTKNTTSTVKIITVKPGQSLSLQFHNKRDEFWRVLSGSGKVQIGEETLEAVPGKEFFIPMNINHRMEASENDHLVILEIAFGDFDEDDIIRLEDRYGRT